jgi:hypothetical protein
MHLDVDVLDIFPKLKKPNVMHSDFEALVLKIKESYLKLKELDNAIKLNRKKWSRQKLRQEVNKRGAQKARVNKDFKMFVLQKSCF